MWEPWPLATLWASTACNRDIFTFTFININLYNCSCDYLYSFCVVWLYCVCSFVCCVSFDRGVILCDVLFVCCVLLYNHCHRVKTHLQLINITLHYIFLTARNGNLTPTPKRRTVWTGHAARRGAMWDRYKIVVRIPERKPITVATWSKAWTVCARLNTGVVGSNPTGGMDVCVPLFCVCVVLCIGRGLAAGLIPRPRSPTDCV
jgi:hypothetical protein